MGKTSFLYRLQEELSPGCACVLVNLELVPDASPASLFRFIATEVVEQMSLDALLPKAEEVTSGVAFERLLCTLPDCVGKATVMIDGIGALPQSTAMYLANVLRAIFSDRLLHGFEALGRFVFVLAGGSELQRLSTTTLSPFSNIATSICLPDLSASESLQLFAHGFSGNPIKLRLLHELSEAVYDQVHGHPYLTQRLAALALESSLRAEGQIDLSSISQARAELIADDENIRHVRQILQDPALLDAAFETQQRAVPSRHLSTRHGQLQALGIIRNEDGVVVPRNALYAHVICRLAEEMGVARAEAPSQRTAPKVSVKLLTTTIPTAFCHNLSAQEFPLVQVLVDNATQPSRPAQVYAQTSIAGFSDIAIAGVTVPEGEQVQVNLLPVFQLEPRLTLTEIRPATLRVTVRQFGSGSELLLYDQTHPIKLHAQDTALLGIRGSNDSIVDLTDYLCAFVTPHAPEIEKLLRKAADHHPQHCIAGYQGAESSDEARQVVREQVLAIYTALKLDAGLTYVNSPLNFGKQEGQITQRVRLPGTSLHESKSRANCVDGTVLYASLLELASLDPVLVIIPGHAFVGWRIWYDLDVYEFLETTMTGTGDFEEALVAGFGQYQQACEAQYFGRGLFDPTGFARLIDVRACRARHIYPLI